MVAPRVCINGCQIIALQFQLSNPQSQGDHYTKHTAAVTPRFVYSNNTTAWWWSLGSARSEIRRKFALVIVIIYIFY